MTLAATSPWQSAIPLSRAVSSSLKEIGKDHHTFRLRTLFYPDNENRNFNFLCAWLEYAAKVVKCRSEGPRLGKHILVGLLRAVTWYREPHPILSRLSKVPRSRSDSY